AGTPREAVMRLEREPMNVPTSMIPLIDVIVTMGRFVSSGAPIRRITDISEIAGVESGKVLLSERYVFDFKAKKLVEMSPSITYRDRLATAAGVSPKELMQELKRRETILRELKRRGLNAIEDLSLFCKTYYEDPEVVLKKLSIKV
ncbi:MAG: hypothetical protein PHF51_04715, partial [Candidatus ainarchaeum sp.]|nr:hypothetical protein [Candidatus ainarchaeum sp.]